MTSNAQTTEETPKSSSSTESTSLENGQTDSSTTPRKRRENVNDKAKRLLLSGRLRIVKVDGNFIVAECRGDSGEVYQLGCFGTSPLWRCSCPARTDCSHMRALWMVVAVER